MKKAHKEHYANYIVKSLASLYAQDINAEITYDDIHADYVNNPDANIVPFLIGQERYQIENIADELSSLNILDRKYLDSGCVYTYQKPSAQRSPTYKHGDEQRVFESVLPYLVFKLPELRSKCYRYFLERQASNPTITSMFTMYAIVKKYTEEHPIPAAYLLINSQTRCYKNIYRALCSLVELHVLDQDGYHWSLKKPSP